MILVALVVVANRSEMRGYESADVYAPSSHEHEDVYLVSLVSEDAQAVEARITRHMSFEAIPYWVEYQVDFPGRGSWHAAATSVALEESWPQLTSVEGGHMPALLIDSFDDGDFVSELGPVWEYRSVNPHTGAWGHIADQSGYQLVLVQNYTHDVVSDTGAVGVHPSICPSHE